MKPLLKTLSTAVISTLLFVYGCEKNPASPDGSADKELSETEQMLIVAAEVAPADGGVMTDLDMAEEMASGKTSGLQKPASFDTTITRDWITYSLNLAFYTASGKELPMYMDKLTYKVIYQGSLTGSHSLSGKNADMTMALDRNSNLTITDANTDTLTVNGTSNNSSEYQFTIKKVNLAVKAGGVLTIKDVKMDTNSGSYIPYSGKVEANIKGKFTKQGGLKEADVDYNFNCTIEFNGNSKVTVSLPNGSKYQLDLTTGDFTKLS